MAKIQKKFLKTLDIYTRRAYNINIKKRKSQEAKEKKKMLKEKINLTEEGTERLIALGASRWSKYGKDRIYLKALAKELGLEFEKYNSGNICSATFKGEVISNSKCGRMLGQMEKAFIDIATGEIVMEGREEEGQLLIDSLKEILGK